MCDETDNKPNPEAELIKKRLAQAKKILLSQKIDIENIYNKIIEMSDSSNKKIEEDFEIERNLTFLL